MRARMTQIRENMELSIGLAKSNKACHARAHDPNTQQKSLISRGGQMKSCKTKQARPHYVYCGFRPCVAGQIRMGQNRS